MYQQFEIEKDGLCSMALAQHTVSSHRKICTDLGILGQYGKPENADGAIGGEAEFESNGHLLNRFFNSAARTQALACINPGETCDIATEILSLLVDGHIFVIDIAAGHGAGTLSLLNTICEMRAAEVLPTSALDVEIFALDYSDTALTHYETLVASLTETYSRHGIRIRLVRHKVDITNDELVRATISAIRKSATSHHMQALGADPRFLLICSAISGVRKKLFIEKFASAYEFIATSFRGANSAFLWVEPLSPKDWMPKYWLQFFEKFGIPISDDNDTQEDAGAPSVRQPYDWIDPYSKNRVGTSGDYFLMELRKP